MKKVMATMLAAATAATMLSGCGAATADLLRQKQQNDYCMQQSPSKGRRDNCS